MTFKELGLSEKLLNILKKNNYNKPTPIQKKVIPFILDSKDIMAKAQTGTGKSASFVLPILEKLSLSRSEGKPKIKVLVLTPTRELTLQVAQYFKTFGTFLSKELKVVSVIGGESLGDQIFEIQKGCDVLVATSGRFLDVLNKKQMNLSYVEYFVLDEADKMLDLGFAEELSLILDSIPDSRQNLMFSATYPQKMLQIASRITTNAIEVSIENEDAIVDTINQRVIEVNKDNRGPLLRNILDEHKYKKVLVFMSSKRATDNIANKFRKHGYKADSFHGDLYQEDRTFTLDEFKNKKLQILFSTDISSRGLDIDGIDCVINFDLPRSPADYIHRIGRTGRAGKSGVAISFIDFEDMEHFKLIEKRSNIKLKREQISGFELEGEAPKKVKGPAPVKGKGKSKKDKLREKALKEKNDANK